MRAWGLLLAASLVAGAACSDNHLPAAGDAGAVDLARAGDLALSSKLDLAGPPAGETCVSACNRCQNGPCCGSVCCNAGEWCDATNTCRCGNGPACSGTLICASGGPVRPGGDQCGGICCGDSSHPCPL
jgi:hypothetical protein